MTKLSVNLNKIATLRNTREIGIPNIVDFGRIALSAGAHGLTVHPRPDERHIRPRDVADLAALLREFPGREFNIEGNPFHRFVEFAEKFRPTQCTLVPDSPDASTSDHGWDLPIDSARLHPIVVQLRSLGCRVSLFMNPKPELMPFAAELGVNRVELYTAPYAESFAAGDRNAAALYTAAARHAQKLGLGVNAGHDLNLHNLHPFVAAVPGVQEVSIGHALIADALEFGLESTVQKYLAALSI